MVDLIEKIVSTEWNEFQKVKNVGGRAMCQDDKKNFVLGRESQFLSWDSKTLESYYQDLIDSKKQNRNLVTEKYAHMLESTSPGEYELIKDKLPDISSEKKNLVEEIVSKVVVWAEELSASYPKLGGTGRIIHSKDDTIFETSFETYLRGELLTYSYKTLKLYYEYIMELTKENKNLSMLIMENTVKSYGYDSLDEAEERLKNNS